MGESNWNQFAKFSTRYSWDLWSQLPMLLHLSPTANGQSIHPLQGLSHCISAFHSLPTRRQKSTSSRIGDLPICRLLKTCCLRRVVDSSLSIESPYFWSDWNSNRFPLINIACTVPMYWWDMVVWSLFNLFQCHAAIDSQISYHNANFWAQCLSVPLELRNGENLQKPFLYSTAIS